MKSRNQSLLVLTALPFRKQGNQSMFRFIEMLINNKHSIYMISCGKDSRGEKALKSNEFIHKKVSSVNFFIISLLKKIFKTKTKTFIDYKKIESKNSLSPSGSLNLKKMIIIWIKFFLQIIDNIILLFYILIFQNIKIFNYQAVVSYENYYFLTSKIISRLFFIKYINKFQGTYLKICDKNRKLMVGHYPHLYYGINKSDLAIMVNDGTDGKYYSNLKGCKNIFFKPHGVSINEYFNNGDVPLELSNIFKNNIVFFNMASGSSWKRVDRIIRALQYLDLDVLSRIKIVTTYHGPGYDKLKQYARFLGVSESIIFLDKLDYLECNSLLRNSHALISTNDLSNLGNPVLEAIYYEIPVISINDGSLDGFLTDNVDSSLIKLDDEFDKNLAITIERFISDESYYNRIKNSIENNQSVNSLEYQQKNEYIAISNVLKGNK